MASDGVVDRNHQLLHDQIGAARGALGQVREAAFFGAAAATSITNALGMTFAPISAGEFWMGTSNEDAETLIRHYPDDHREIFESEMPQHRVAISEPFYIGIYPVTQAQWEAVMGDNPSACQHSPTHPVENVSWNDVQQFLARLSASDDCYSYALPTEAQWEYACRAGSNSAYCFGDDDEQLDQYAWYRWNAKSHSYPVGQKKPMPGGSMTCMAMCGSGYGMPMDLIQ